MIECFNYIEAAVQVALTEGVEAMLARLDVQHSPVRSYLQLVYAFGCLHREQFDQALPLASEA